MTLYSDINIGDWLNCIDEMVNIQVNRYLNPLLTPVT